MKNYICIDGKKIPISCETAKNLKRELGEKPSEIRHGDYGYAINKQLNIALLLNEDRCQDAGLKLFNEYGILKTLDPQEEIKTVVGNIFDDLKRNAEDLEDVKIPVVSQIAHIHIYDDNEIRLIIEGGVKTLYMSPEIATEIAHAILQEVATLRRQAKDY